MDQLVAYKPKLDLWAHQREALAKLLEKKNFALFMEMRTGKTATVLCEFGYLEAHGQLSDMLVIAPAGVYGVWADDIDGDGRNGSVNVDGERFADGTDGKRSDDQRDAGGDHSGELQCERERAR